MDYYLKFKDKAEANEVLKDYTGDIDVIGIMYQPSTVDTEIYYNEPGRTEPTPIIIDAPEPIPIEGWHVNVRGKICPELEPYALNLDTPKRVWY